MVLGINRHYHRKEVNRLAKVATEKARNGYADAELLATLEQLRAKVFSVKVINRMGITYYQESRKKLLETCRNTMNDKNISVIGKEVSNILLNAVSINEYPGRSKDDNADKLSRSVSDIYGEMVNLTDDPALLTFLSENISTMNEDQDLWFNANGEQTYNRQVQRCLYLEERIFKKVSNDFYLDRIASHVVGQVTFDRASFKFGKKFAENTGLALNILEDARDKYNKDTPEYYAIDRYVVELITQPEFIPYVDEEILDKRGLLKLDVSGDELKTNLEVMHVFLEDKDQYVLAVYKEKLANEIAAREKFSENKDTGAPPETDADPVFISVVEISELRKFQQELEQKSIQLQTAQPG